MFKQIRTIIVLSVLVSFIVSSIQIPAFAQSANPSDWRDLTAGGIDPMPFMPTPGTMVSLSPEYTPAYLKGIVIHPENALKFDFIIYKGDKPLTDAQKREEYTKLTKYFLASLAIPDDDQWVNLSPYEKDRIIKDDFGKTEMGRDLLAQDYLLKQITASLLYPQESLGKKFWDRVYTQTQKQYGTTNIPVNTFNKVWILPDDALIYEKGNTAYVLKNHLRVMLEEDYLSLAKHSGISSSVIARSEATKQSFTNTLGSQIIKQIILPELQREVNEDKNFAPLRQVYSGMLLATWFKRTLKQSLLGQIYANKAKIAGVDYPVSSRAPLPVSLRGAPLPVSLRGGLRQDGLPTKQSFSTESIEAIYHQYLQAYKKGVFNFIKEDVNKYTNETIPRKYFSGGTGSYETARAILGRDSVQITHSLDFAQRSNVESELPTADLATVAMSEMTLANSDADHGMFAEGAFRSMEEFYEKAGFTEKRVQLTVAQTWIEADETKSGSWMEALELMRLIAQTVKRLNIRPNQAKALWNLRNFVFYPKDKPFLNTILESPDLTTRVLEVLPEYVRWRGMRKTLLSDIQRETSWPFERASGATQAPLKGGPISETPEFEITSIPLSDSLTRFRMYANYKNIFYPDSKKYFRPLAKYRIKNDTFIIDEMQPDKWPLLSEESKSRVRDWNLRILWEILKLARVSGSHTIVYSPPGVLQRLYGMNHVAAISLYRQYTQFPYDNGFRLAVSENAHIRSVLGRSSLVWELKLPSDNEVMSLDAAMRAKTKKRMATSKNLTRRDSFLTIGSLIAILVASDFYIKLSNIPIEEFNISDVPSERMKAYLLSGVEKMKVYLKDPTKAEYDPIALDKYLSAVGVGLVNDPQQYEGRVINYIFKFERGQHFQWILARMLSSYRRYRMAWRDEKEIQKYRVASEYILRLTHLDGIARIAAKVYLRGGYPQLSMQYYAYLAREENYPSGALEIIRKAIQERKGPDDAAMRGKDGAMDVDEEIRHPLLDMVAGGIRSLGYENILQRFQTDEDLAGFLQPYGEVPLARDYSPIYDFVQQLIEDWNQPILDSFNATKGIKTVEIGSGNGELLARLQRENPHERFIGIDPYVPARIFAKAVKAIVYMDGGGLTPIKAGGADRVIIYYPFQKTISGTSRSFRNIPFSEYMTRILMEARRILRPEGEVTVVTENREFGTDEGAPTTQRVQEALINAGFQIVSTKRFEKVNANYPETEFGRRSRFNRSGEGASVQFIARKKGFASANPESPTPFSKPPYDLKSGQVDLPQLKAVLAWASKRVSERMGFDVHATIVADEIINGSKSGSPKGMLLVLEHNGSEEQNRDVRNAFLKAINESTGKALKVFDKGLFWDEDTTESLEMFIPLRSGNYEKVQDVNIEMFTLPAATLRQNAEVKAIDILFKYRALLKFSAETSDYQRLMGAYFRMIAWVKEELGVDLVETHFRKMASFLDQRGATDDEIIAAYAEHFSGGNRAMTTRKNAAMRKEANEDRAMKSRSPFGGIDLNSANLNLRIKRDGNGVPLPLAQQDLAQLNNIEGLDPVILSIKPASQTALFSQLVAQP